MFQSQGVDMGLRQKRTHIYYPRFSSDQDWEDRQIFRPVHSTPELQSPVHRSSTNTGSCSQSWLSHYQGPAGAFALGMAG